jgi:cysteine synthase A
LTSGAAAKVACDVAKRPEFRGGTVVCLFSDTGERYLSVNGLFPA